MVFIYVTLCKRQALLFLFGVWIKILFVLKSCFSLMSYVVSKRVWNKVTVFPQETFGSRKGHY